MTAPGGAVASKLALICDCDGVLINSETVAAHYLIQELSARWPDVDVGPVVMPLLGLRTERVLTETAAAVGRTLAPADIEAIHQIVQGAAIKAPAVEGIAEALANIPLQRACASNSFLVYVTQVLERTGLAQFFSGNLFTADMVRNPKPAADVYLLAASELAVDPERCLVVEDSVAGATAAARAGMTVLGYVGSSHHPAEQMIKLRQAGASRTFHHMNELPGLADQWIKKMTLTWPLSTAQ